MKEDAEVDALENLMAKAEAHNDEDFKVPPSLGPFQAAEVEEAYQAYQVPLDL